MSSYPRLLEFLGLKCKSDTPLYPHHDLGIKSVEGKDIILSSEITEFRSPEGDMWTNSEGRVSLPEVGHVSWETPDGRHIVAFNSRGKPNL